jgi:hypothetical protein
MLPKSVMILGHKTKIVHTKDLPVEKDDDTVGLADILDHVIHIHKDISKESKRRIMLHEIFHHAMWRNGATQSISKEMEEVLCQTFSYLYDELKRQNI